MNLPDPHLPRRHGRGFPFLAGLLLCLACVAGQALHANEPAPNPPLVGSAPNPSAWVITVKQKKTLQPPSDPKAAALFQKMALALPRTLRVEVEKAGVDRCEVSFLENNLTDSLFIHDGWVVYQPLNWPRTQALAVPINHRLSPIKGGIKSDFTDLDWVRADVYVGRRSYGGQDCYYYEDKKHAPLSGGSSLLAVPPGVHAWIEVNTRLPLAVEDEAVLKTYAYRSSNVNVTLPDVFAAAYKRARAAQEKDNTTKE